MGNAPPDRSQVTRRTSAGKAWGAWAIGGAGALLVGLTFPALTVAAAPQVGEIKGTVSVAGAPSANRSSMVVFLESLAGTAPVTRTKNEIRQKDQVFRPEVMVITKGSTIDFPNDDKVFHNVFSLSSAAKFDLGLYKSGDTKSVTFNKAGVIDVYCNIHPQMAAKILVLDTAYSGRVRADGTFSISNVPVGTHSFVAWQPWGKSARGEIAVEAGKAASLRVEVEEGKKPGSHLRKDGTPYGRYK